MWIREDDSDRFALHAVSELVASDRRHGREPRHPGRRRVVSARCGRRHARDHHAGARRRTPRLPSRTSHRSRAAARQRGALPVDVRAEPTADGRLRPSDLIL